MTSGDVLEIAQRFAEGLAAREELMRCLGASLEPLSQSCWPDVAWRFSRLTVDGCPVEFGVSSIDDTFRVTFEVAGPESPDHERLAASLDILRDFVHCEPDSSTTRRWRNLQANGRLRWGAWAGLRCSGARVEPKLYLEVPRDIHFTAPTPLPGRVRMIGFDPIRGRIETYVALSQLTQSALLHLLADLHDKTKHALLDTLTNLLGVPLHIALNWIGLGASIIEGAPTRQFALFIRARVVREGEPQFRKLFARNRAYRAWLDRRPVGELPDHGVLTLIPREHGRIEIRAGLSARSLKEGFR